jgi:2-methylfumaryl-CoA isomerase
MAGVEKALAADFGDESERYRCRDVIAALLGNWFARHSWSEVQNVLTRSRALGAPYRTFNDLAADHGALLRSNPLFAEIDQPGVGAVPRCRRSVAARRGPGAGLAGAQVGEHTDEVLAGIGLEPERLAAMRADGLIG